MTNAKKNNVKYFLLELIWVQVYLGIASFNNVLINFILNIDNKVTYFTFL